LEKSLLLFMIFYILIRWSEQKRAGIEKKVFRCKKNHRARLQRWAKGPNDRSSYTDSTFRLFRQTLLIYFRFCIELLYRSVLKSFFFQSSDPVFSLKVGSTFVSADCNGPFVDPTLKLNRFFEHYSISKYVPADSIAWF
jgi:hypothetical protein